MTDRRLEGRNRPRDKPAKVTTMKVYESTKNKIDSLWPLQGMPLGDRLDLILADYERLKLDTCVNT